VREPSHERPSRRIVETEDIAELAIGISVVAIVVLGQHDGDRTKELTEPNRRSPSQLAGVAPPYVKLA
jgi:hypothetical protein